MRKLTEGYCTLRTTFTRMFGHFSLVMATGQHLKLYEAWAKKQCFHAQNSTARRVEWFVMLHTIFMASSRRVYLPEEIWDTYGGDVHVDYEQLKTSSLGQAVQFKIRLGQIGGRPQGREIRLAGPAPTVLPATSPSAAADVVAPAWRRVLLLGEGDFSFASAAAIKHLDQDVRLDATTVQLG